MAVSRPSSWPDHHFSNDHEILKRTKKKRAHLATSQRLRRKCQIFASVSLVATTTADVSPVRVLGVATRVDRFI